MKTHMLSEHFSLREFTASATAEKYHINNMPDTQALENMRLLCRQILEPLRHRFGPIYINSGYRCELLNNLLHGVGNSQHLFGEAADIRLPNEQAGQAYFDFILLHCPFDQLLFEYSRFGRIWLHVSCKRHPGDNRRMARRRYQV